MILPHDSIRFSFTARDAGAFMVHCGTPPVTMHIMQGMYLPIIVDPSHGTGKRNKVLPLSRAAVAVGADGLMVEVHHDPDHALSDGMQSIFPDQFDEMMHEIRQIAVAKAGR